MPLGIDKAVRYNVWDGQDGWHVFDIGQHVRLARSQNGHEVSWIAVSTETSKRIPIDSRILALAVRYYQRTGCGHIKQLLNHLDIKLSGKAIQKSPTK